MDKATTIMEKNWEAYCSGEMARKDIIEELIAKADLTKAGAGTYFQIIKSRIVADEY
jgi:hypothetical protein